MTLWYSYIYGQSCDIIPMLEKFESLTKRNKYLSPDLLGYYEQLTMIKNLSGYRFVYR